MINETAIKDFDWQELENEQARTLLKSNNKLIEKKYGNAKVFSNDSYAEELFLKIMKINVTPKDFTVGDILKVKDIIPKNGLNITVLLENGLTPEIELEKEKKYCNIFSETDQSMAEKLRNEDYKNEILKTEPYVILHGDANNPKADLYGGYVVKTHKDFIDEINNPKNAFIAKVKEKNRGGFLVDVSGIECFLPGGLAATNKIINFDDYIGKEIPVMIEDYLKDSNIFIVSNKKYVSYILPSKIKELSFKEKYTGTVTGTTRFGIFLEWNEIFTGLLHTSKMDTLTLENFKKGNIKAGDKLNFWILDIVKETKIILTEKDPDKRNFEFDKFVEEYENKVITTKALKKIPKTGFLFKVGDRVGLLHNTELKKLEKHIQEDDTLDLLVKEIDFDKIVLKVPDETSKKL